MIFITLTWVARGGVLSPYLVLCRMVMKGLQMLGNLNLGCVSDQVDARGDFTLLFFAVFFPPSVCGKRSAVSGVASVFPTLHLQQVSSLGPRDFEAEPGQSCRSHFNVST